MGSGKDTVGVIIQYLTFINDNLENEDYYPLPSFISNLLCNKNAISEEFETQWKIKKFADKLKDMVCLLIGCTREQLEDQDFKNKELGEEWNCYIFNNGKKEELTLNYNIAKTLSADNRIISRILTPRLLLQVIGTDCIRDKVHPNAWVNALFADYKYEIHRSEVPTRAAGFIDQHVYPNWIITDMRFPNELEAVKSRGGITIRVNRLNSTNQNGHTYINKKDRTHPSEISLDSATFDYVIDNNGTIEELIENVKEILIKENIIK